MTIKSFVLQRVQLLNLATVPIGFTPSGIPTWHFRSRHRYITLHLWQTPSWLMRRVFCGCSTLLTCESSRLVDCARDRPASSFKLSVSRQTRVNEAIVSVQQFTFNTRVDTKLGEVGS